MELEPMMVIDQIPKADITIVGMKKSCRQRVNVGCQSFRIFYLCPGSYP